MLKLIAESISFSFYDLQLFEVGRFTFKGRQIIISLKRILLARVLVILSFPYFGIVDNVYFPQIPL